MRIVNIYPIANQKFYAYEKITMILAHLLKKGLYDPSHFNRDQYIIMDNGAYEKSMVSNSLQDCIDIAEASGIPANEIIIPDVFGDLEGTIKLFNDNRDTIIKYGKKYNFMFVAHNKNIDELRKAFLFAREHDYCESIVIGVPKCSGTQRNSHEAIEIYKQCSLPIHFLGVKRSFSELLPVKDIIRSCDTSQVSYIAKNYDIVNNFNNMSDHSMILDIGRSKDMGPDIDLEYDKLDDIKLRKILNWEKGAFNKYGIL